VTDILSGIVVIVFSTAELDAALTINSGAVSVVRRREDLAPVAWTQVR